MNKERAIEKKVSDYANAVGILSFKFAAPSYRGVPDRIYLYKGQAMFIEFKRPGKTTLDPLQEVMRDKFQAQGFIVRVCNAVTAGQRMVYEFKEEVDNATP